jgi:[ribosomal protein S18]-alanine N-acetyltransferase
MSGRPGAVRGIGIRAMATGDLDAVLAIERQAFTMPWNRETFLGLLRQKDATLLVAEAPGPDNPGSAQGHDFPAAVVGYAVVWRVMDQAELGDIAVADGWRRRGIGRCLLEAVLRLAAEQGVRELFLEVRPSNTEARRLYERYGFVEVGRRKDYYVRPQEDALVLRRLT